jgi:hypothetical protein
MCVVVQIMDIIPKWFHVFIQDRGTYKHYNICFISLHIRRRLKCEKLTDDGCQVMEKAHIAFSKMS